MAENNVNQVDYYPTPTGAKFHNCCKRVKGIMGPVGSGKSVCCILELLKLAYAQRPNKQKIRKTRWMVVRNTYSDLTTTTIKSFQDWIPQSICPLNYSHAPIDGVMRIALEDGTQVEAEFWFMALDRPEAVSKLKSCEITGAWINEARYIHESIMSTLIERSGRYPSERDGFPSWAGLIMDTNPPSNAHWYYYKAEIECPEDWEFFRQPPAILRDENDRPYVNVAGDPDRGIGPAENLNHLFEGPGYYIKQLSSKKPMEIKVDLEGQYGFLHAGKPVWSQYKDQFHFSKEPLTILRGLPLIMGTDNGRTPATLIGQLTPWGQLRILREVFPPHGTTIGANNFIEKYVKPMLNNEFADMRRKNWCDPACLQKSQHDEICVMDVWNKLGIDTETPSSSNVLQPRLESVENRFVGLTDSGHGDIEPAIIIDPACTFLREALQGGYHIELVKKAGVADEWKEEPAKDRYSHICDALQYMCLANDEDYASIREQFSGGGEHDVTINQSVVW